MHCCVEHFGGFHLIPLQDMHVLLALFLQAAFVIERKVQEIRIIQEISNKSYVWTSLFDIFKRCSRKKSGSWGICWTCSIFVFSAQLTRPVNGEHTLRVSPNAVYEVVEVDKKFEQTMKELEARTKSNVPRCLNVGCTNFGNGRCRGYCHGCFKLF